MMGLKWNGRRAAAQVRRAELAAVDETIRAAAQAAAVGRSGRAANLTTEAAQSTARGVSGRWGLFPAPAGDPFWELFVETGTATQPGDGAKRRAMDQEYPKLAGRIRSHRGR